MEPLDVLQQKLQYRFHNPQLLQMALTHSSVSPVENNERLEFLGDAVLEIAISRYLYDAFPNLPEGRLTKMRAAAVREETLSHIAMQDVGLGAFLLLGKSEQATNGRKKPSILSDALEAVIGAIYLDGGMEQAHTFVLRFIQKYISDEIVFDPKTALQEKAQAQGKRVLYELVNESGPPHKRTFQAAVYVDGKRLGTGFGGSKKSAEQQAASAALAALQEN